MDAISVPSSLVSVSERCLGCEIPKSATDDYNVISFRRTWKQNPTTTPSPPGISNSHLDVPEKSEAAAHSAVSAVSIV